MSFIFNIFYYLKCLVTKQSEDDEFVQNILKYQNILDSNKYADSNDLAYTKGIKKLVDSALNYKSLDSEDYDILLDGQKENANPRLQTEIISFNHDEVVPKEDIPQKNITEFLEKQVHLQNELEDEGFLPGQPVFIPPKFGWSKDNNFTLSSFKPPGWIYNALINYDLESLNLNEKVTPLNYKNYFQNLLWIEEAHQAAEMRSFDLTNVMLSKFENFFSLSVPGLAESRPSLLVGDKLYIKNEMRQAKYEGYIHVVREKDILIKLDERVTAADTDGLRFEISFVANRAAFRRCHHAVTQFNRDNFPSSALFPDRNNLKTRMPLFDIKEEDLNFYSPRNDIQKKAVINIMRNVCRPMPYILFGPPGTGKTETLVEIIHQVYKQNPRFKILVCGNSNSSVFLITEKLITAGIISKDRILRVIAQCRVKKDESTSESIKYVTKTMDMVNEHEWEAHQIFLMTCSQSGAFNNIGQELFDFIVIDESGHAQEPEALISLSLLAYNGAAVIAGDPFQLGPVVMSQIAREYGLGESLLERLFDILIDSNNPKFDRRYITKLEISYRSDERIMTINNKLFYNNTLKFKNKTPEKWLTLLDVNYPLIFCEVKGREMRERSNPSWFNCQELMTCFSFINRLYNGGLKATNLGFITPYRQQINKMDTLFSSTHLERCKIGTMEEFQGFEREVIIISTVRTQKNIDIDKKFQLGFLNQAKRFNVGISRAKWLVIVVGDPEILKLDLRWKEYMETCRQNGSYMQRESIKRVSTC